MDWKRAMEEERAALMRLVAMLCSLADLAERAGGRSRPVRGFVLWILGYAEAAVRDLFDDIPDAQLVEAPICPAPDGPDEAARLAASFRAMARRLDRQARLVIRAGDRGQAAPPPLGPRLIPAMRVLLEVLSPLAAFACPARHPAHAPDTS